MNIKLEKNLIAGLVLLMANSEAFAKSPVAWTEQFKYAGPGGIANSQSLAEFAWQVNYTDSAILIAADEKNWDKSFVITDQNMAATAAAALFSGKPFLLWTDKVGSTGVDISQVVAFDLTMQNEVPSAKQAAGPYQETSLAIRVGRAWYVSESTVSNPAKTAFNRTFDPKKIKWESLRFISGKTLSRGSAASLPETGKLEAIGIFADKFVGARVRLRDISVGAEVSAQTVSSTEEPSAEPVLGVKSGLFDHSEPRTFGLTPIEAEKNAVFPVVENDTYRYQLGTTLSAFQGELYMVWAQNILRESTPDGRIVYSRSPDGVSWSAPQVLFTREMLTTEDRILDSTGMWVADGILHAYVALSHKEVYVKTSSDGSEWSEPVKWIDKMGGITEPPRKTESGWVWLGQNISEGRALKFLYHDNDSFHGFSGWKTADVTGELPVAGWREPATFIRPDGTLIATIRGHGQADGGRGILYAAESRDGGRRWRGAATDFPDANSRVSTGMLPDGTVYLINNPGPPGNRSILSIALSADGKIFDRAYALGYDVPPIRWPAYGKPASLKGYQYPHSVTWKDHLIVACSLNKEDIYIFRIPLEKLMHSSDQKSSNRGRLFEYDINKDGQNERFVCRSEDHPDRWVVQQQSGSGKWVDLGEVSLVFPLFSGGKNSLFYLCYLSLHTHDASDPIHMITLLPDGRIRETTRPFSDEETSAIYSGTHDLTDTDGTPNGERIARHFFGNPLDLKIRVCTL